MVLRRGARPRPSLTSVPLLQQQLEHAADRVDRRARQILLTRMVHTKRCSVEKTALTVTACGWERIRF
jgi:hypothetical protein